MAFLSANCLDKDVEALPEPRRELMNEIASHLVLAGQSIAVFFERSLKTEVDLRRVNEEALAEREVAIKKLNRKVDDARAIADAEKKVKESALTRAQQLEIKLQAAEARATSAEASATEARNSAESLRQKLASFEASKEKEMEEYGLAVQENTIQTLKKNVDTAIAKKMGEVMKQGFTLGYEQALEAAAVPRGTALWTLPAVPAYVDPEGSESEADDPEDSVNAEAAGDTSSKPPGDESTEGPQDKAVDERASTSQQVETGTENADNAEAGAS